VPLSLALALALALDLQDVMIGLEIRRNPLTVAVSTASHSHLNQQMTIRFKTFWDVKHILLVLSFVLCRLNDLW
jgi:hypothetical protein